MPRISKKNQCLEIVLTNATASLLWAESEDQVDEDLMDCVSNFQIIQQYRYIGPRDNKIPKSQDWYLKILPNYDDSRFKSCLRVSRNDFRLLFNLICYNQVFQYQAKKNTTSIEKQLAVSLYRFGCNGSGVSFWKIGQLFGISDAGNIRNCTDRVIKAFLDLERQYIQWPTFEERKETEAYMEDRLPKCVGYLDGSHVNLFEAPMENHESYYSRKQKYGIQIQAICDNNCIIRSLSVGFPASVHDARVFLNTPFGKNPINFLSDGQWLAADSAYKLTEHVLTPFRDNSNFGTRHERAKFNSHFSGYRVKIEQTFGILKMVFQSLQSLRIRVDKKAGHKRACEWIVACCIIYNIVRPAIDVETLELDDDDEVCSDGSTVTGELKRAKLFEWINNLEFRN